MKLKADLTCVSIHLTLYSENEALHASFPTPTSSTFVTSFAVISKLLLQVHYSSDPFISYCWCCERFEPCSAAPMDGAWKNAVHHYFSHCPWEACRQAEHSCLPQPVGVGEELEVWRG